ncbi:MAG: hypothetical protein Q7U57_01565 [Methylovulum sp.]|nr:hypothetical protein [Methylovulum sp.]
MNVYTQADEKSFALYYVHAALVFCLLTLLTACDQQQLPQPTQTANSISSAPQTSVPTPEIKWAVANKYKVTEAIKIALTNADPEIESQNAHYNEAVKERKLIDEQIDRLTQQIKDKCGGEKSKDKNKPHEIHLKGGRNLGEQGGFAITISELEDIRRGHNNPDYWDCIDKAKKEDKQMIDLQGKLARLSDLFLEKRQNDQMFRERANNTFTQLIDTYGQLHGYQLIISGGSELVLFNQSKVVLDITEDLLAFIAQQPLTPKQPLNSAPSVPES